MIGASCTSGHPRDPHASPPTSPSNPPTRRSITIRARASPAQAFLGEASEGAVEAPSEEESPPPSKLATEIRFNDALVRLDDARRPLGDLLAVVENEHGLAQAHHDL